MTSLFLAVTLILAIRPHAVFDAGLWLSFLSTFGILCVMPAFSRKSVAYKTEKRAKALCKRIGSFLAGTIMMSITATFFTMPVTYLLYGSVSLVSPLANLIFVPLTQLLLYLLAALSVLCFVPFLPELLGAMCRLLTDGICELAVWASDFRGIYISIRYPFASVILILLVIGIMILLLTERLRPIRILAVFLTCTVAFGGAFVVFRQMNSGRTDVFLQTNGKSDVVGFVDGRETVLVDITTGGYAVPSLAVDTLASYYACEIDTFVLTHLHSYHAGTLKKLADKIKIHRILLPMAESEAERAITASILSALDGACEVDYYDRSGESMLETESMRLHLPALQFLCQCCRAGTFVRERISKGCFSCYLRCAWLRDEEYY